MITNCTITGNKVTFACGGIGCGSNSSSVITNCIITKNSANGDAGGIGCWYSSPTITGCIITGNDAHWSGGILCEFNCVSRITNCIIAGNSADGKGGGVGSGFNSSPTIQNCTITENSANNSGGGIVCYKNSSATINKTILWENAPQEISGSSSSITITYSDVQGGWKGEGNIKVDPLFEDLEYHLKSCSPCINAGTPDGAPSEDIEGNSRPEGVSIDMGAYEFTKTPDVQPKSKLATTWGNIKSD